MLPPKGQEADSKQMSKHQQTRYSQYKNTSFSMQKKKLRDFACVYDFVSKLIKFEREKNILRFRLFCVFFFLFCIVNGFFFFSYSKKLIQNSFVQCTILHIPPSSVHAVLSVLQAFPLKFTPVTHKRYSVEGGSPDNTWEVVFPGTMYSFTLLPNEFLTTIK